jgi:SHS family lactate transporter-like MFS transporter
MRKFVKEPPVWLENRRRQRVEQREVPIFFANLGLFLSACGWGWWADRFGRRWAIIIPALIALPLAPLYLLSTNFLWIAIGFIAQGMCAGGGMQGRTR